MTVSTDNLVSITEANQNFSKVAKLVDQNGSVVILKNNRPKYLVSKFEDNSPTGENELLRAVARLILTEHINAFKELAK